MAELRGLCERAGFSEVRTYIASGNVVLRSDAASARVKAMLESVLEAYAGRPVGVMVRSPEEMSAVLADHPFPDAAPNRVVAIFPDDAPSADALDGVSGRKDEQLALGRREIYVHYGDGMAQSKLNVPASKTGTARNMNTIARLVERARG
ncbi:DUF1697 domain-containing protein [Marilutibacter chinensis]|uniref:DUF1697 domain-containing protein n=1 Tax=Marilutibacter chinensis TaxID=2912247 RepID=A0ABS9HQL7_9GAMM|nr:DUF1697 domain-containing protein [Lysobacter chinensis]MCF7221230.1 DUF1697 domain-containing protein [Lysobacter chinensis]MCF7223029.1 DUF1697 domain-containing protein [Lysobacter chinensis]